MRLSYGLIHIQETKLENNQRRIGFFRQYGRRVLEVRKQTGTYTVTLDDVNTGKAAEAIFCPPVQKRRSLSRSDRTASGDGVKAANTVGQDANRQTYMAGKRHRSVALLSSGVKRRRQIGKTWFDSKIVRQVPPQMCFSAVPPCPPPPLRQGVETYEMFWVHTVAIATLYLPPPPPLPQAG